MIAVKDNWSQGLLGVLGVQSLDPDPAINALRILYYQVTASYLQAAPHPGSFVGTTSTQALKPVIMPATRREYVSAARAAVLG
jgi:hypothetical protein